MTVAANAGGVRTVLANPEYRAIWLADVQSTFGDQLARIAISILVFERTGSQLAAAGAYAVTFAPAILGGLLLGHVADRFPRRTVLVSCDVLRGILLLSLVFSVPLWLLYVATAGAVFLGSPFMAAEPALIADIVTGDLYVVAVGLRATTAQVTYLAGFAGGGLIVEALGPHLAFALDAATFGLSAVLIRRGVRPRPAAFDRHQEQGPDNPQGGGFREIWHDPALRSILSLAWLAGFWVVPEGLAVPYAASKGGGGLSAGLLLAAIPAGAACGAIILTRVVRPSARAQLVGPLAVGAGLPLIAFAFRPDLPLTMVLWALCGAASAYQVVLMAEYVQHVPAAVRGRALGIATAGLIGAQGVGLLAAGALAQAWSTSAALATAGVVGIAVSATLLAGRRRVLQAAGARN